MMYCRGVRPGIVVTMQAPDEYTLDSWTYKDPQGNPVAASSDSIARWRRGLQACFGFAVKQGFKRIHILGMISLVNNQLQVLCDPFTVGVASPNSTSSTGGSSGSNGKTTGASSTCGNKYQEVHTCLLLDRFGTRIHLVTHHVHGTECRQPSLRQIWVISTLAQAYIENWNWQSQLGLCACPPLHRRPPPAMW